VNPDHDDLRRLLGGYLLGGLDDADTDRLDAHLRDCDECRDELERLAPVPELLQRLPDAQRAFPGSAQAPVSMSARPTAENVEGLLRRMRAERSRESRLARVRWLAAAAVVVVAAVIGIGVIRTSRETQSPQVLPSPQTVSLARDLMPQVMAARHGFGSNPYLRIRVRSCSRLILSRCAARV